jgi:hypothetical protein
MKLTRGWTRFLGSCLAVCGLFFVFNKPAQASDYGCRVLLCLSNPNGPKAAEGCAPPIDQLFDDLAHFRPFPSCDLADGNDGSSYARQTNTPYDPCPQGTTEAPAGSHVVQGTPNTTKWGVSGYTTVGAVGLSGASSDGVGDHNAGAGQISSLACVGNPVGSYQVQDYSYQDQTDYGYTVLVYDQVVWQAPQSPRSIDVFINNTLYKRVHW